MDIKKANTIADAVAQYEYYKNIIDNAKEEIRALTEKEITAINTKSNLHIARSAKHFYTYTEDYNAKLKALKSTCLIEDKEIPNYNITLTLSNANVIEKANTIQEIAKQSKTKVKKLAASIQKEKRANKKK